MISSNRAGRIKLINISIRTKLLIMYILCVLVPIVVFSSIFYSSVMKNAQKEKIILFQQSLERLGGVVDSHAVSAIQLSNVIFPDEAMYEFLNKTYTDRKQCLNDYQAYMQTAWEKALPYNTEISGFQIFTTNNTLLNSFILQYVDNTIAAMDWYAAYSESGRDRFFLSHIDQPLPLSGIEKVRLVSFLRILDYIYSTDYRHFLKITFKDDMFDRILRSENMPGDVYILNNDRMILDQTNNEDPRYNGTLLVPFDVKRISPEKIILKTQLQAMKGWEIILAVDKGFLHTEFRNSRFHIFLLMLFITVFTSFIIWIISASLYKRIDALVEHMGKVQRGEYSLMPEAGKGNDEIGLLITAMNKMVAKIKSLIEDIYKAKLEQAKIEVLKKQSELNALQCQVNPHFMFNVLETIRIKAYLKNEFETSRIVKYMSSLFRKLLLWNDDMIELREELDFINEYLEIQQYRYEDELEFEITVDEELLPLKIPKMTLQTFVDNACEHGFTNKQTLKIIRISIRLIDGKVKINIYDNGRGIEPDVIANITGPCNSGGIGIKNVISRLDLYYKEHYHFNLDSKMGEYTRIILILDMAALRRYKYV